MIASHYLYHITKIVCPVSSFSAEAMVMSAFRLSRAVSRASGSTTFSGDKIIWDL